MLEELLRKRRSIRKFQDRAVPKDAMDRLLKAVLLSPSSRNIRPWTFIAVDDPALISALSFAKQHGSEFLKTAPAAVAVIADTAACDVWVEDASIASAILLLEAEALHLGACWCQIRSRPHDASLSADAYVRNLLHIPEGFSVESIIGLGYPAEQIPPYTEDDLKIDRLRLNAFSMPYLLNSLALK